MRKLILAVLAITAVAGPAVAKWDDIDWCEPFCAPTPPPVPR